MTDEEFHERRLIAFRQSIATQPSLLQMGRLHLERVADEPPGRKAHPAVRRVRRRVGTAVHPDCAVALECLVVPVNGNQALRVRIALLPGAGVADGTY